jgi:hypothetical protein
MEVNKHSAGRLFKIFTRPAPARQETPFPRGGRSERRSETEMNEDDIELPILPRLDKGPPPDCPICGDPMSFIDGDWACVDCNGELLGPETG